MTQSNITYNKNIKRPRNFVDFVFSGDIGTDRNLAKTRGIAEVFSAISANSTILGQRNVASPVNFISYNAFMVTRDHDPFNRNSGALLKSIMNVAFTKGSINYLNN
jgi:hypothetical protein